MISAEGLSLTLDRTPILSGVDLALDSPGSVALVGRSGAGKTSLLHCLAGLRPPTTGRVLFRGRDIGALSPRDRAALRLKNFGFVFQRADLIPELTLVQNIALPLEMAGERQARAHRRAMVLVEALGLEECSGRRPDRVSGGQRQRAAIGRALIGSPSVVFADEPTGALDTENGEIVMDLLLRCTADLSALLVMVTHDLGLAHRCDRVVTMADGRISSDTGAFRAPEYVS